MKNPYHPVIEPQRLSLGNPEAEITIVEYSDLLCSYCAEAAQTIKALVKKYPEKIRVVFKHNPENLLSQKAAIYFEAIGLQSPAMALQFHDIILERQQQINTEKDLQTMISLFDIDDTKFIQSIQYNELKKIIDDDTTEMKNFGFEGSPIFLVNGISIPEAASMEHFEKIIQLVEQKKMYMSEAQ